MMSISEYNQYILLLYTYTTDMQVSLILLMHIMWSLAIEMKLMLETVIIYITILLTSTNENHTIKTRSNSIII